MVSGFLTSPKDQERICSGDAIEIRIESKLCGPWTLPNKFISSFIFLFDNILLIIQSYDDWLLKLQCFTDHYGMPFF